MNVCISQAKVAYHCSRGGNIIRMVKFKDNCQVSITILRQSNLALGVFVPGHERDVSSVAVL